MMTFGLAAAGLVLVALASVLVPLWRRRSTGEGLRWLWLLAVVVPLATFGLYRQLGAPAILDVEPALQGRSHDAEAMLAALEARLRKQPDDAEGWYVLGRAYQAQQRIAEAEAALAKAVTLSPTTARYLSHHAEAMALADQGDLQKRARAQVEAALELDPQEEKALELAGLAAYQRQEWAQAAFYWRHLLKRLPPGSEFYQDIETALKQARGKAEHASGLGEPPPASPPAR